MRRVVLAVLFCASPALVVACGGRTLAEPDGDADAPDAVVISVGGDEPEAATEAGEADTFTGPSALDASAPDATRLDASSDAVDEPDSQSVSGSDSASDAIGASDAAPAPDAPDTTDAGVSVDASADAAADASDDGAPSCPRGICPVAIASGRVNPWNLAVNATAVYWTETGHTIPSGVVMSVGLDGGTPVAIASNQPSAYAIALDGANVYWSNAGTRGAPDTILSAPLGGGPSTVLATTNLPFSIAVGGGNVYWVTGPALKTLALQPGASPQTLAMGTSAAAVVVDATNVYWTDSGTQGSSDGSIWKAPLAGGTPTLLASGQPNPSAIAVDGANVYWTNFGAPNGSGSVMQVPIGGGTPVTIASELPDPRAIATDGSYVYWLSTAIGVYKAPVGGGPTTTLAGGLPSIPYAWDLAVDDTSVYFTAEQSIMKLTPK
jgi:hypothetical protein